MGEEKPLSYLEQEGLDALFLEIQGQFDRLYQSVRDRRNVEGFAGENIAPDTEKLNKILDKLNGILEPLRAADDQTIRKEHIMASIDVILELLAFIGNKGPIKPDVKAKLDTAIRMENVKFGTEHELRSRIMYIASVAGAVMEGATLNLLHSAIFAMTAYIAKKSEHDDTILAHSVETGEKTDWSRSLAKLAPHLGKHPEQAYAIINKLRSTVLAAGIAIMSINSAGSLRSSHQPFVDVASLISDSAPAREGNLNKMENAIKLAITTIRMFMLLAAFRRLRDSYVTIGKIDYATFQRYKTDELEKTAFSNNQLRTFGKLYVQLQDVLKRMGKNENYDPTPVIEAIKEGLEAVANGETINVRTYLEPSKRAARAEQKQKIVTQKTVEKVTEDGNAIENLRKRIRTSILDITRFELPEMRKKLTRQERKELYEKNKAADNTDTVEQTPVPAEQFVEDTPTPAPAAEIAAPAGTETEKTTKDREQVIKTMTFQRVLDGSQFRKFLKAMRFERKNGKGSHQKYSLETSNGTVLVVVSANFDQFGDVVIKNDLLKQNPILNPEWIYWSYCKCFGFPESINAYEQFFGKTFDGNNEPPQT